VGFQTPDVPCACARATVCVAFFARRVFVCSKPFSHIASIRHGQPDRCGPVSGPEPWMRGGSPGFAPSHPGPVHIRAARNCAAWTSKLLELAIEGENPCSGGLPSARHDGA